jgi:hypothetical protein
VPDAGNGCEGNQADQQCVFNQILTFVAGCQILQLDTQRKKYVVYLSHHLLILPMNHFISRAQSAFRGPYSHSRFFQYSAYKEVPKSKQESEAVPYHFHVIAQFWTKNSPGSQIQSGMKTAPELPA